MNSVLQTKYLMQPTNLLHDLSRKLKHYKDEINPNVLVAQQHQTLFRLFVAFEPSVL